MLEIEIDGKKLTVPQGSTVMDAAYSVGIYIPHFCYHKKLSIAANCRMCLVEVEKAPKPLPACATPITDGMKVSTHSLLAQNAQKGVMELLLINHPLDCPICDQGGECMLQDLAVGYGPAQSRYQEAKRTIEPKEMGPLVCAAEMNRCIQCTRCVRFTEEIGGKQELGMAERGEHAEILTFLGQSIHSELSGNVIDLCPVGALTSKPFRYTARAWELSRRKSISPHDGLGTNLIVQVKNNTVMRVLPLENDAINECWLADRDRFSYEGLNSEQRLVTPMIKQDGVWQKTDWSTALHEVHRRLNQVAASAGKDAIGVLANPHATCEELFLLQQFARAWGVDNIDYRLRHSDFRLDHAQQGALWLGSSIVELLAKEAILLIGCQLRQEQPLLAARLRQAVKHGTQLNVINVISEELLTSAHSHWVVSPLAVVNTLAQVLKALCDIQSSVSSWDLSAVVVSPNAEKIAHSLINAESCALVLGQSAQSHPSFSTLWALTCAIAQLTGASFGLCAPAANSVGAELVGVVPHRGPLNQPVRLGLNAQAMIAKPCQAYLLLHSEAEFDSYNPAATVSALQSAQTVIAMSAYQSEGLLNYADILLPIAPFSETAGSFVNMEGRLQSFNAVVRPLGEARPAWKVLRVLADLFKLTGFEYQTAEDIRQAWLGQNDLAPYLNNRVIDDLSVKSASLDSTDFTSLIRVADVPLYQTDAICRRAPSLQKTIWATLPEASAHSATLAQYDLCAGSTIVVHQDTGHVTVRVNVDDQLPIGVLRLATAHPHTMSLGGMFATLNITKR